MAVREEDVVKSLVEKVCESHSGEFYLSTG